MDVKWLLLLIPGASTVSASEQANLSGAAREAAPPVTMLQGQEAGG